jgi:hypothetical protein
MIRNGPWFLLVRQMPMSRSEMLFLINRRYPVLAEGVADHHHRGQADLLEQIEIAVRQIDGPGIIRTLNH